MNGESHSGTYLQGRPVLKNDAMETKLPVMEQFYTLQGEGCWTGSAAYFIRLGGCDVGCVWCDVKESWDIAPGQYEDVEALTRKAKESGAPRVVVTGGEPCMHDLSQLTASLRAAGLKTHLETSGAYPVTGQWDWICLSPKKFKAPLPENFPLAHELKIIVYNKHDFVWAEEQAAKCGEASIRYYLQPEWSRQDEMTSGIIEYIKKHPKWQLSLQTHKFTGIP